ncbi:MULTISPECIES: hypothetical protein [unclassified Moraxella]|uniref:hypothetical protein n=1 Tax=unclassified Moraxella TaxID=2685852 RepID=UPI00359D3139
MIDYSKPLNPKDILVVFFDELKGDIAARNAQSVCKKYQINFVAAKSLKEIDVICRSSNFKINHFIVRLKSSFNKYIIEQLRSITNENYISGSIAFSYKDKNQSLLHEDEISIEKENPGSLRCLNIMRPDEVNQDGFIVSDIKIMDNIICDTIRLKYNAVCLNNNSLLNTIPDDVKEFFINASKYYDRYRMYHRSSTDGYFAIRKTEGIYITATKTPKDRSLDLNRISLIKSYNRNLNTIEYNGAYLPSSDSVEAYVVFEKNPNIQQIIHTHDSKNFTRNSGRANIPFVPPTYYGEPELGDFVSKVYQETRSPIIILQEHGEMFLGNEKVTSFEVIDGILK